MNDDARAKASDVASHHSGGTTSSDKESKHDSIATSGGGNEAPSSSHSGEPTFYSNGSSESSRPLHHQHQHQQQQQQQQQQQPHHYYGHYMKWGGDRAAEEDSSIHYLSEPSISEAGDSSTITTGDRHPYSLDRSLLSGMSGDDEDDDNDNNGAPPPPPPPGRPPPARNNSLSSAASTGVASPGNTSLSSWESHFRHGGGGPHRHGVKIHFSPEPPRTRLRQDNHPPAVADHPYQHLPQHYLIAPQSIPARQEQQPYPQNSMQQQQQTHHDDANHHNHGNIGPTTAEPNNNANNSHNNNNPMSYSTFSVSTMSSVSTKERAKLDYFISDLRTKSEGALQESTLGHDHSSLLNTSAEDSFASPQGQRQRQKNSQQTRRKGATLETVLRKTPPGGTTTAGNGSNTLQDAIRPSRHRRISSVETELIGNTSDAYLEEEDDNDDDHHGNNDTDNQLQYRQHSKERVPSMEESPLMLNLSLLGDDDDNGIRSGVQKVQKGTRLFPAEQAAAFKDDGDTQDKKPPSVIHDAGPQGIHSVSGNTTDVLGDSNHTYTTDDGDDDDPRHHRATDSHHSADDEQTLLRPPRKRGNNTAMLHRRTRSGDGAAAALTTGGHDWKGMFKDKIPMPVGDDDDDDESKEGSPVKGKESKGEGNGKKIPISNSEKAVFSVGAADGAVASRAAARKQRRETRQQHRTMGEKAAAVATEQRIKKQYQEWSQSPLWNRTDQHLARMDSSEVSTGSVPSTIERRFLPSSARVGSQPGRSDARRIDDEVPQKRTSLDTLSSGLSTPSAHGHSGRVNRRSSTGSNHSIFSWISTSNHDTAPGSSLSPSPRGQNQAIQVHPNWSPQTASLASPMWHQRKQAQTRQNRHERSHTAIGGGAYPHNEFNYENHPLAQQRQASFRRQLAQQQQQQLSGNDSSRFLSLGSSAPIRSQTFDGICPPPPLTTSASHEPFVFPRRHSDGGGEHRSSSNNTTSSSSTDEEDDEFMDVMQNQVHQMHPQIGMESLERAEQSAESELLRRGSYQQVLRGAHRGESPFANFGRKRAETGPRKFDKQSFLPKTSVLQDNDDEVDYPTYQCPRCQTLQREFFTVNSAPRQYETASGFLAFAFVAYVIASLYIFGLEEGWPALDCIYFAVITLTTAGLGDFVPTSDFNKIICSIFIYFGVACIGLLLGSYIAGMLDETSRREARENRLNACPNCTRLQNIRDAAEKRDMAALTASLRGHPAHRHLSEHIGYHHGHTAAATYDTRDGMSPERFEHDGSPYSGNKKIKRQHQSGTMGSTIPESKATIIPSPSNAQAPRKTSARFAGRTDKVSPGRPIDRDTAINTQTSMGLDGHIRAADRRQQSKLSVTTDGTLPPHPTLGVIGVSPSSQKSVVGPVTPKQTPKTLLQADLLGSPMTKEILGRQSHTRHASIDINGGFSFQNISIPMSTSHEAPTIGLTKGGQTPTISENAPFVPGTHNSLPNEQRRSVRFDRADSSFSEHGFSTEVSSVVSTDSDSFDSKDSDQFELTRRRVRTAKYVFLTLKEALVNSMVIIAVGCLGFFFIERFSLVDSWYFATVLLTTVGYGDIVPVTRGGKLFSTIYILVAGSILLNQMSHIAAIPLELRKRRIERAVLTQFGDLLDDEALKELASGPLIQRIHLSANRADGLNECTREMFALAMLVRLGKVTEDDILETFNAFNRLDVNREGVLNSRSIIAGMINKSRHKANLASFNSGMTRVGSSNNMMKTPRGPSPSMYGGNHEGVHAGNMQMGNAYTPQAQGYGFENVTSNPIHIPNPPPPPSHGATTETSSLLQNDYGTTNAILSRSAG